MLETEESISETDSHYILLEGSEVWSCNEAGFWQFELKSTLVILAYSFSKSRAVFESPFL